jgi:hypothetical protein
MIGFKKSSVMPPIKKILISKRDADSRKPVKD